VPATQGIRQFVVGPGGAKPAEKESEKAKGPMPAGAFAGWQQFVLIAIWCRNVARPARHLRRERSLHPRRAKVFRGFGV
jgi:hypothetical protein